MEQSPVRGIGGPCGRHRGNGPYRARPGRLRVVFGDAADLGPDRCPGCGELRVLRIEFDEPSQARVLGGV